jgi:SAM-dependent methyltransferase
VESVNRAAHAVLERVGLHGPVLRARDRQLARRALRHDPQVAGPDGFALPPAELMVQVTGVPAAEHYLAGGALAREVITAVLARNGVAVAQLGALLDFGVGCGRVARQWADLETEVHGCDYNPVLVEWCRRNLPHVHAAVNRLQPPLPYDDARFDLVYALSIFTHLNEPQQRAWIAELRRVTRPGGHVLFTTHGPTMRFTDPNWPTPDMRAGLEAGELVVILPDHAGRNACTALHPRAWVEHHMLAGFELSEYAAGGATMNGGQDLFLLRRL